MLPNMLILLRLIVVGSRTQYPGRYRCRGQFAPKGMAVAKLGLVFNIGGRMLQ